MSKGQQNKLQEEADAYLRKHHIVELFEVISQPPLLTPAGPVHVALVPPALERESVPGGAAPAQEGQGAQDRALRLRGDHQHLQAVRLEEGGIYK